MTRHALVPLIAGTVMALGNGLVLAQSNALSLTVDVLTGEVLVGNPSSGPITFDAYAIESPAGSLDFSAWNSLSNQGFAGWQEETKNASEIAESTMGVGLTLNPGNILFLGDPYSATVDAQDLTFTYYNGPSTMFEGGVQYVSEPGGTADNPINPTGVVEGGGFRFEDAPSGAWFDPPLVPGFEYTMESASLFTEIMDFPLGFDSPFEVYAAGQLLGAFSPGESVDFVTLLGHGVEQFAVLGISPVVDAADPNAFPLKIAFSTDTATFRMTPVPEASAAYGLCLLIGVRSVGRRGSR